MSASARFMALLVLGLVVVGCAERTRPPETVRLVKETSTSPLVALHFAFHTGSVDDPAGREGLTALTASTMLEGGGAGYTPEALRQALFPLAATIEVDVDREWTGFVVRVHRDHVPRMLALLEPVLVDPALPADTIERLRERAESELVLGLLGTNEEGLAREALRLEVFGAGHPYSHPTVGTERALEAITREDVVAHRRRVFCRSRLRAGVSGDAPSDVDARIVAFVAKLPDDACAPPVVTAPSSEHAREALLLAAPDASSVAIRVGIPHDVTRAHPDYVALTVAAAHLGLHGQFLGTLMQDVREARGLNYGDYVYAEPHVSAGEFRGASPHHLVSHPLFEAWIRPVQPANAQFTLRLVVRSFERLVTDGIADAELARVRDFLLRTMPLSLEVDEARLGFAMDADAYGVVTTWPVQMRRRARAAHRRGRESSGERASRSEPAAHRARRRRRRGARRSPGRGDAVADPLQSRRGRRGAA